MKKNRINFSECILSLLCFQLLFTFNLKAQSSVDMKLNEYKVQSSSSIECLKYKVEFIISERNNTGTLVASQLWESIDIFNVRKDLISRSSENSVNDMRLVSIPDTVYIQVVVKPFGLRKNSIPESFPNIVVRTSLYLKHSISSNCVFAVNPELTPEISIADEALIKQQDYKYFLGQAYYRLALPVSLWALLDKYGIDGVVHHLNQLIVNLSIKESGKEGQCSVEYLHYTCIGLPSY